MPIAPSATGHLTLGACQVTPEQDRAVVSAIVFHRDTAETFEHSRKWWSTQAVYGSGKVEKQILNFSFSGWKIPFPLEVERLEAGHGSQRRRKASLMVVTCCYRCCPNNGCQRIPLQARVPLCAHGARAFPVWAVPVLGLFQMEEEWAGLQTDSQSKDVWLAPGVQIKVPTMVEEGVFNGPLSSKWTGFPNFLIVCDKRTSVVFQSMGFNCGHLQYLAT